jgi:aspartokinase
MTNVGQSITGYVREIVSNDIYLQAAMRGGYSNYSAVARMIKPMVDKKVGYDVGYQSIVTALKRFKPNIPQVNKNVIMVLADSNISVKTGVAKITVEKTRAIMIRFTDFIRKYIHSIIHISLGTSAITIIMDEDLSEEAFDFLGKASSLEFKKGLAAISVTSPPDITDVPGCAISIYEKLFSSGVNIEDTTSSYTDTVILVKSEDVGRAFETLNSLINESKRAMKIHFQR